MEDKKQDDLNMPLLFTILIIILLALMGFIIYSKSNVKNNKTKTNDNNISEKIEDDSNDNKTEGSNNILEKIQDDSNNKKTIDNLSVGDVGIKNTSLDLNLNYGKLIVENGKVVYVKTDGSKIVDETIKEKVLYIESAGSCDGYDNRVMVLTEDGNIYYNSTEYTENPHSSKKTEYSLNFFKVNTDEKIYGVEALYPKVAMSCGTKVFVVYVNKTDRIIVNVKRGWVDDEYIALSASLGENYDKKYSYTYFQGIYWRDKTKLLKVYDDGKIKIDKYISNGTSQIIAKEIYYSFKEKKFYIIDKENDLYILTILDEEYKYDLEQSKKEILSIEKEELQTGYLNINIKYTDNNIDKIENVLNIMK